MARVRAILTTGLLLLLAHAVGCEDSEAPPVDDDDSAFSDDDDSAADDDDAGPADDDDAAPPDPDSDDDGWRVEEDCDDEDPAVFPGAPEVCNDVDDDCDGLVDELPPADGGTPVRFAIIGDYGDGSLAEASVAALVDSWNPEFILTNGDNNYPDGSVWTIDWNIGCHYGAYIGDYQGICGGAGSPTARFFPSLGNHDWNTAGAQPYLDYFTLPGNERYYDFVRGPVHLFALDSDRREPDGNTAGSAQGRWLEAALAASTSPFRLVYFHHAPYSSGAHGSSTFMQWPFADWGASLTSSGHEHSYERLFAGGLPHTVNGSGGVRLRSFDAGIPGSLVRHNEAHGAQLAVADSLRLTLDFIDVWSNLVDSFTLRAGALEALEAGPGEPLIEEGALWSFWDFDSEPDPDWAQPGFVEGGWEQGPSPLGYGAWGPATEVGFGGDPDWKHLQAWFRHEFEVESVCGIGHLRLRVQRDDGAIVYVNGVEAWRSNLPAGEILPEQRAAFRVHSGQSAAWVDTWLDPSLLVGGTNTIAVRVHQHSRDSEDLRLNLELTAY